MNLFKRIFKREQTDTFVYEDRFESVVSAQIDEDTALWHALADVNEAIGKLDPKVGQELAAKLLQRVTEK